MKLFNLFGKPKRIRGVLEITSTKICQDQGSMNSHNILSHNICDEFVYLVGNQVRAKIIEKNQICALL